MSQQSSHKHDQELAFVAVGANLPSDHGNAKATITKALEAFEPLGLHIQQRSNLYETPCFPVGYGPDYLNAVIAVRCSYESKNLLAKLHEIENNLGRTRDARWGGRVLDLDLLAHGNRVLPDRQMFETWQKLPLDQQVQATPDQMILPHPRIQDRAFVLVPFFDVAPDWVHPVLKQSVQQMHAGLSAQDLAEITPVDW